MAGLTGLPACLWIYILSVKTLTRVGIDSGGAI